MKNHHVQDHQHDDHFVVVAMVDVEVNLKNNLSYPVLFLSTLIGHGGRGGGGGDNRNNYKGGGGGRGGHQGSRGGGRGGGQQGGQLRQGR